MRKSKNNNFSSAKPNKGHKEYKKKDKNSELVARHTDFGNRHIVCTKILKPKTINQSKYLKSFDENTITVGIGSAGTGKTLLPVFYAIQQILIKNFDKLIITRPIVEAGEKLGFLPGELEDKVDPFMRPIIDAIRDVIGPKYKEWMEYHVEIAPLAYLRGRTLSNSFIIYDEAQNGTKEQNLMFLTRIGEGSKVVLTADPTQIDLRPKSSSGIFEIMQFLEGKPSINFIYFTEQDILRSEIVKVIVDSYRVGREPQVELKKDGNTEVNLYEQYPDPDTGEILYKLIA